ncbi:MAG TPA: DHH family phosphoesterase [Candidatus Deferrimicrobium sp.]|nr:DHH family phosphoesterase [Candidatus Deferrimicrobium sp.]
MIICHNDADGFASAGILLLTKKENLDELRYSTVRNINYYLKKFHNKTPQPLYLLDINADDSDNFIQNLIKLQHKGFKITLIDHHQLPENYDTELKETGINIIRNTAMSCSELMFHSFINTIEDKRKAEFFLCIGAIGDRLITPFVQKIINSFRREEIFDVYACLLAGITNGKDFIYSIFEEKDKDGVGFTKKIYYQATKKRFFIEKLKAKVNILKESTESICTVHIFQKYIGFAASYLIDQENINFTIAIGDGPPDFRNRFYFYITKFLRFIFRRKEKAKDDIVRISFRSKIPINTLVSNISKKYNGFGGGHSYACGASIHKDQLVPFLKEIIREFKNL